MSTGRRINEDDKVLVSEVGRMIHVIKTNEKQRKVIRRAKRNAETGAKDAAKRDVSAATGGSKKKRNGNSGSLWITFSPSYRDAAISTEREETLGQWRLLSSQKKREKALQTAVAYYASALGQAKEASLASEQGAPLSAEGSAYLQEQYAIAKEMLSTVPVGTLRVQRLTAVGPETGSALVAGSLTDEVGRNCLAWAKAQIAEERRLLQAPPLFASDDESAGPSPATAASSSIEEDAIALVQSMYFTVASDSNSASLCVVKVKGPARKKVTTIVSSQRTANNLKTNLTQLLRKEASQLLQKPAVEANTRSNIPTSPKVGPKSTSSGKNGNKNTRK